MRAFGAPVVVLALTLWVSASVVHAQAGATRPHPAPKPTIQAVRTAASFADAIDQLHAFDGTQDAMARLMDQAERWAKASPRSGHAQALQAEYLSTWRLDQEGQPRDVAALAMQLADEALRLNPKLAQAHVAKARVHARVGRLDEARAAVGHALKLDAALPGAVFMQGDVERRAGRLDASERAYLRFITIAPTATRRANGMYWLGMLYLDAAYDGIGTASEPELVAKARNTFEALMALDARKWSHLDHAIFLNGPGADFEAAEAHLLRAARDVPNHPHHVEMIRAHLAAARYQQLAQALASSRYEDVRQKAQAIEQATGVSLAELCSYDGFGIAMAVRLGTLHKHLSSMPVASI